jgi:DNA-binding transcriptional ArsR family regulator
MMREDVFRAIADPTRRAMLSLLNESDRSVGELMAPFSMSQPAVSQHLKVLRGAGLVTVRQEGRQRYYRLEPEQLKEVYDWLAHFRHFWEEKLDALEDYLERKH